MGIHAGSRVARCALLNAVSMNAYIHGGSLYGNQYDLICTNVL